PGLAALLAGGAMLQLVLPGEDRLLGLPVAHGDAKTGLVTAVLDAEIARLVGRQLLHAFGGGAVALLDRAALGGEDHRVVGRRGGLRETVSGHRRLSRNGR